MKRRPRKFGIDRRAFLHSAAAAGSFLAVGAGDGESSRKAPSETLNVALIGAGTQGMTLLSACMRIPGVRITAVCDIWEAMALKRAVRVLSRFGHDHRTYTDYREMLEKEKNLDAAIVATPDFRHAEQTTACLKAGLHVYCETPMAHTLDEARLMVKTKRATGKLLQIGQQRRSNPKYRHCGEKLLRELNLLGRLGVVNAQWNESSAHHRGWPRRSPIPRELLDRCGYRTMERFRNWRWYRDLGGGPFTAFASHQLDVINWFLGARPAAVTVSAGTDFYDPKTHQWPDTVLALYEYKSGARTIRAFYQVVTMNPHHGSRETFLGDKATMILSEERNIAAVYLEKPDDSWERWVNLGYLKMINSADVPADKIPDVASLLGTDTLPPIEYGIPIKFTQPEHKPHLENFFDAVRGKARLTCPAETGYETAVTVLKLREALKSGGKAMFSPEEFEVKA